MFRQWRKEEMKVFKILIFVVAFGKNFLTFFNFKRKKQLINLLAVLLTLVNGQESSEPGHKHGHHGEHHRPKHHEQASPTAS